jgi:hypothetical protein
MTVGVPPFGVVTVRKDSKSFRRQDVLRQIPEQCINLLLGEEGAGRPRWRTWYSWRPSSEGSISSEVCCLCHQPLRKSTRVSGIGSLKGGREVQTNREPSGRGKCKVGHCSSSVLVLFVSQTTMVQRRLNQNRYCVVLGFRPLTLQQSCFHVSDSHDSQMTGSTTGHQRVGPFVDRGRSTLNITIV